MSQRDRLAQFSRLVLTAAFALTGCHSEESVEHGKGSAEVGEASWYGPGFQGNETASGETFDQNKMTAAHPTLPMGTTARVTNLANDKKVEVRINDRGPYEGNRVIDLSRAAASKLDMVDDGASRVRIEAQAQAQPQPRTDSGNTSR